MKILHILNTKHLSGAENVVADICMMFKDQIDMVYCSPKGQISEALKDRSVTFIPVNDLSLLQINKVIKKYNPDIIHAHDIKATLIGALLTKKIPLVSHLHGNQEDMRKFSIKSLIYYLSTIKAKKIIMVSKSCLLDYYFKKFIYKKTTILKNIIYKSRIEQLTLKDTNKYNFDFVFLGRLSYPKNPERVAIVASMVLNRLPDAKFGVIGDGELKKSMVSIFKQNGVSDRVVFTGKLEYPYNALKASKCILMCSRFEGTPIAALEAMFLGLPIVSTPTDGIIDLVDQGVTGFLSDDNNVLADYVVKMLTNQEMRNDFSNQEMVKFNTLNNIDQYKKDLFGIYNSLL